ncbi:hypothetical protein [Streptomyces omiyaensis]|uniref:hypothetical protein n=1 Tax=Streptomyces omiyaensis TaxID=68247 RepID=UPI0016770A0E|nr:hypothetical protein [Streptomyces omiyaensis]
MSTSSALPVLRTADLPTVHRAARRLLDLVTPLEDYVVTAEIRELPLAEAQAMAASLPGAVVSAVDHYGTVANDEIKRGIAAGDLWVRTSLLPVSFCLETRPARLVEETFIRLVGSRTGYLEWDFFAWPAVAELGLRERDKDARVQIAINSQDIYQEIPSTDHTLFIHLREGDMERGEWLARQIDLRPEGPVQHGY